MNALSRKRNVSSQTIYENKNQVGVLCFIVNETGIQCGDTEASLTGKTLAGESFQGKDSIVTFGCKRRP